MLLLLIVGGLVISALKNLDAALAAISRLNMSTADLCFARESCILGPLVWGWQYSAARSAVAGHFA